MSIEKIFTIPDHDKKPFLVNAGSYFCYECNKEQVIRFNNCELKPCAKCGKKTFFKI